MTYPNAMTSPSATSRRGFLTHSAGAFAALALEPRLQPWTRLTGREELTVAVVGVGRQGRAILGELQKIGGVKIAAICDVDDSRLKSGARRAQGASEYASVEELLSKEAGVEALFVATPTPTHEVVALAAIEAGKHVYCEAPLAASLESCRKLARAARAAGTVCQAGFQGRSNPVYQLARSFHRAGATGDLAAMRAQWFKKTSWRTPASDPAREAALNWRLDPETSLGLAGEVGAQQFDVVHWFLSRYPVSVRGTGSVRYWRDGRTVPDTVACELSFADGATLSYQACLANSYEGSYELISGSLAAIKLAWSHAWMFKEADAPTLGWEVYANRQQFHQDEGITLIADATQLAAQDKLKEGVGLPESPLHYSLADFLKSVTEQAEVSCSFEEGLRATVVGMRVNEAILSGEQVAIDEADLKVE